MASVVTYKCPNCDGELTFDPSTQRFGCEYCGSSFTELELRGQATAETVQPKREETKSEDSKKKEEEAAVFVCPSCGAQIVTDATTAATTCYYCHNPVVLSGRLEGAFRPEKVIPFRIGREEAVNLFLSWVKKKKFVPKAFFNQAQLEKMAGVYYPYWMIDCTVDAAMEASAQRVKVWRTGDIEYTQTSFYRLSRAGKIQYSDLLKNALSKADHGFAEGIQPFDPKAVEDFSMAYLSGFQAEKRDVEESAAFQQARQEIEGYTQALLRGTMNGYSAIQPQNTRAQIEAKDSHYLLLPVWTLTYHRNGKLYYYVMNGQNGKVCGKLPVSWKRLGLLFGSVTVALSALLMLGGYFL